MSYMNRKKVSVGRFISSWDQKSFPMLWPLYVNNFRYECHVCVTPNMHDRGMPALIKPTVEQKH